MDERKKTIGVLLSLWILDNPDPPLDKEGRLMREYVNDFYESGFMEEEIKEGIRIYRRDHQYPQRNFAFLWTCCKEVWDNRCGLITPGEAWMITVKIVNSLSIPREPWLITPWMVTEFTPSIESAKRIVEIIQKYHWKGIFTENPTADRARFIDAYKAVDHKMTNRETWQTPSALLPEGETSKAVAQLTDTLKQEKQIGH